MRSSPRTRARPLFSERRSSMAPPGSATRSTTSRAKVSAGFQVAVRPPSDRRTGRGWSMGGLDAGAPGGLPLADGGRAPAAHADPGGESETMAEVTCARCGETRDGLPFAPFNNELGQRIHAGDLPGLLGRVAQAADDADQPLRPERARPEAKQFLYEQTEKFLFATGETEQVDTSKQGTIQW
jgi:Fe-S cluster biosynthesis and repair protein YggX